MLSIDEAIERGITKLRRPEWVEKRDHIELTIVDGLPAAWVQLWSPSNESVNGQNPCLIFIGELNRTERAYEPYEGRVRAKA